MNTRITVCCALLLALPLRAVDPAPFTTGVLRGQDDAQHVRVSIAGWRDLYLIVSDDGDYNHDVANWAEAKLITSDGTETFLDTIEPASAEQAWGKFKRDNKSTVGGPMQIAQRKFARGLGTHAESLIHYQLTNEFAFFDAWAGVDASRNSAEGSVQFIVSRVPVARPAEVADLKQINLKALRLAITDLSAISGKHFDQSQTVRWRGFLCVALGRMGGEDARIALERYGSDPKQPRDIRYSVVVGLRFIGSRKSLPVLDQIARDDVIWMVRDEAQRAAGDIRLLNEMHMAKQ